MPDRLSSAPPEPTSQRIIWGALGLVLSFVVGYGVLSLFSDAAKPAPPGRLPILGIVPTFSLIERTQQPFGHTDLTGSIWVANFIFTHCPGRCPLLSQRMARLHTTLRTKPVRFVSFSVDPERDTPEVLQVYARRYRADGQRWLFLTGERSAMYALIRNGFRLGVEALAPNDPRLTTHEPIVHSNRFVLIDPQRRIRGYYRGDDTESIAQLLQDLETLMATRSAPGG